MTEEEAILFAGALGTIARLEKEIEKLKAQRLLLDQRIRNQRCANRENWEIVEMRRKWLGSDAARKSYASLLKRHKELLAKTGAL